MKSGPALLTQPDDAIPIILTNDNVGSQGLDAVAAILRDYPADHIRYLPFMAVDPERRRRGLGRAFYGAVEQWAAARGAREIRLVALEANDGGERFWRSLDFREIRRVGPCEFKSRTHRRTEFSRVIDAAARRSWLSSLARP